MVEDFPYTDEQIALFAQTLPNHDETDAKGDLADLLAAGIKVTFPEPRYYVEQVHPTGGGWNIYDRTRPGGWVASFSALLPDPEHSARFWADRLNEAT